MLKLRQPVAVRHSLQDDPFQLPREVHVLLEEGGDRWCNCNVEYVAWIGLKNRGFFFGSFECFLQGVGLKPSLDARLKRHDKNKFTVENYSWVCKEDAQPMPRSIVQIGQWNWNWRAKPAPRIDLPKSIEGAIEAHRQACHKGAHDPKCNACIEMGKKAAMEHAT